MSNDYRSEFLRSVEESIAGLIEPEMITIISNEVTKLLANYEITERCTDVVTIDPINERLLKRYCACLTVDGKSEKTIYQYRRSVQRFSDFIQKPFTETGAYDVRYYLACEKERGISNTSLENTRANLSAFFQWMALEDIIVKNPMLKVNKIKCPQEIKKPFSDVEIDSLRSACKDRKERALVEMLLSSGVRVSELSEMGVMDVDGSTLSVHVRHAKGGSERMTYTTAIGLKHLNDYLNSRAEPESAWLFCNGKHEQLKPGGIRAILIRIAKRAGVVNVHPHRFRRTFATNLSKRGMAIEEIQKLLGHKSLNTTLKYVCTDDEQVKISYRKYTSL